MERTWSLLSMVLFAFIEKSGEIALHGALDLEQKCFQEVRRAHEEQQGLSRGCIVYETGSCRA